MRTLFASALSGLLLAIPLASMADDAATRAAKLSIGQALPAFSAPADSGSAWESAQHVGKKVVVFYFYPGDFTGSCTRQAQAYRDALAKIEGLGAEVVGVSGDTVDSHKLFKATYDLKHSLLADPEGKLAAQLGIPVTSGGKLRATGPDRTPLRDAEGKRIDVERGVTFPRWTVVVDRKGKIVSVRSAVKALEDPDDVVKIVEVLGR